MTLPSEPASLVGISVRRPKNRPRREKSGDLTERIAKAPAAPTPPLPTPAVPAPHAAKHANEPPPRAEEIVVYWERLRRGRALPPLADVDRNVVANGWPDSLVVVFDDDPSAMPRISRLGATDGAIEYTPMVTDWILTCARHSAQRAQKLDEVQDFPMDGDRPRYRLISLPLGVSPGPSEGVLCHLCRVG
jgi:hypothetical protein